MILFNESGISLVRATVLKAAERNGFANQAEDMLSSKNMDVLNTRANMFLCLGINCVGQTVAMHNVFYFIRRGANRFFLSLKNRFELAESMFKNDLYPGKYNLAMDYYIGPAVFDTEIVSDDILKEWNLMISPIIVKGRHGLKVVRISTNDDPENVKYRFVDRWVNKKKKV